MVDVARLQQRWSHLLPRGRLSRLRVRSARGPDTVINHRRVFFSNGNEGANAWACIRLKVNGFADVAVVGLWENHFLTPRRAMEIVAHARPIRV